MAIGILRRVGNALGRIRAARAVKRRAATSLLGARIAFLRDRRLEGRPNSSFITNARLEKGLLWLTMGGRRYWYYGTPAKWSNIMRRGGRYYNRYIKLRR